MLFKNVIGQEAVSRTFENILKHERLGHAYLFTGPMGVGKFHFARELAKTLLCSTFRQAQGSEQGRTTQNTNPRNSQPPDIQAACNHCPTCRQIEAGWHPNLNITDLAAGEKNISIDAIRRIEREIILKPMRGKYKIFIINDADTLVEEGFNALLKTLEEPPAYALLILVTSKPESILPTVFSRCQLIRFAPINDRMLNDFFVRQLKCPEKESELLAYLSQGSIGTGCFLKESGFLQQRESLLDRLTNGGLAEEIISYAQSGKKNLEENRRQVIRQFNVLALFFYDVLMLHCGLEQHLINQDKKKLLHRIKSASSPDKIIRITETLIEAERLLKLNANYKLVVENVVFNIADSLSP